MPRPQHKNGKSEVLSFSMPEKEKRIFDENAISFGGTSRFVKFLLRFWLDYKNKIK